MSEAQSRGQTARMQSVVSRTLQLTLWASTGFAAVFAVLAFPIGRLLYRSDEVGMFLAVLSPLVPAMYTESIADGLLKGLGRQTATLRFCVVDSAVRILLTVILLPHFGMAGFLFVMLLSNLLSCFLNLHHLLAVTGVSFRLWRWLLGPALSAALIASGVHGAADPQRHTGGKLLLPRRFLRSPCWLPISCSPFAWAASAKLICFPVSVPGAQPFLPPFCPLSRTTRPPGASARRCLR